MKVNYMPLNDAYKRLRAHIGPQQIQRAALSELPRTVRQTKTQITKALAHTGLSAAQLKTRISARVEKRNLAGVVGFYKGSQRVGAARYKVKRTKAGIQLRGRKGYRKLIPNAFFIPKSKYSQPLVLKRTGNKLQPVLATDKLHKDFINALPTVAPTMLANHTQRMINRLQRRAKVLT